MSYVTSFYTITTQVWVKKKKSAPQFKQSRMFLTFIDWSLQASAKLQAQITVVWKKAGF